MPSKITLRLFPGAAFTEGVIFCAFHRLPEALLRSVKAARHTCVGTAYNAITGLLILGDARSTNAAAPVGENL